ncbi:MAG: HAMP domain-containing sensor histidine kinase [Planctomycetota bacterium]
MKANTTPEPPIIQPTAGAHSPTTLATPLPRRIVSETIRWQWYHLYFVLALFDVIVIISSLIAYSGSLSSFEHALRQLERIHRHQRWLVQLRLGVMALNAPGNDVFESRNPAGERERFERIDGDIQRIISRRQGFDVDTTEFTGHLQNMIGEEQKIFELFENMARAPLGKDVCDDRIGIAAVAMATMDRHQESAMTALTELEQGATTRTASLLREHGERLQKHLWLGRSYGLLVVLILVSVFWYGRKLLRLHEGMILSQNAAIAERRERLAAVGEVCSAVAHGIRNPLASISTSAQLVVEHGKTDGASKRRMEDILTECRRLGDRVSHLLQFAAAPAQNPAVYSLREVVSQAMEEIRPRLEESNITLQSEWIPQRLLVRGDPERMALAVIEILSNSLDQLPQGGKITVGCGLSGSEQNLVRLDFIDNGPGIPPPIRPHVFELFFTTKRGGTGIGLASVKRTIEFHSGKINVVDSPEPGLHLQVTLPLVSAPE